MPRDAAGQSDVARFTKDWRRLQQQKQRTKGGVEARMLVNLAMRFGEQYAMQSRDAIFSRPVDKDEDKNKLSLVFNFIKKQRRRKMGRLWSIHNSFRATPDIPKDPKALDTAVVVNNCIRGLNKKLHEQRQHWRRLGWLLDCGVVVEHTPFIDEATEETVPAYDPNTGELLWRDNMNPDPDAALPQSVVERAVQSGISPERFDVIEHVQLVGEVGSEIISPLQFFIDASVPTISELVGGQACYILYIKTVDWICDTFGNEFRSQIGNSSGKDLSIVKTRLLDKGPSIANLNMKDLIPAINGSQGADDPPMCLFGVRYEPSCRKYPHGRRSLFVPDACMLDDGEDPFGMPLTDIHYEEPSTTFWTGDFITDLIAPQKFVNKRMSQLGEASNAQIYEILLLGGELEKNDVPTDMPGVVEDGLAEDGTPRVAPLQRGQLPSWFLESIKVSVEMLTNLGSSDLMDNRQFPGQLRGPMALPMLQEILDSEDGPLYSHLGEQIAQIHQQRINRVKQFYPPIRTMHFTGDSKKDEVLVFHTDKVLRSGYSFSISVDPGSLLPEFSALKEARIVERLSGPLAGLYFDRRTGKIDYSKVAFELRYTDSDDEDRGSQYRTLATHLISRMWNGEALPPEVPYAFWDHAVVLDELESHMATTEYLEASALTKKNFEDFYERCRQFLASIQESQMQAVQGQMMQGAIAQVTQQTAAKVAAEATDAALAQIQAQARATVVNPPQDQVGAAMMARQPGRPM